MSIKYNIYNELEVSEIYLCNPNQGKVGILNGIDKDSCSLTKNLQDFDMLTFTVNKYIEIDGQEVISNLYDTITILKELYVDGVGRFVITTPPSVSADGESESKIIEAKSIEYKWMYKNIVDFKINSGEDTSIERMIDGNVDALGATLEYISLYNSSNKQLSLLDLLCDKLGGGWSVGYVDPLVAVKTYQFSIDNQDIYSFLTQTVASTFKCIFKFDTLNKTINAYSEDSIGEDTTVFVGFRNLANTIDIESASDEIYTRFTVRGNDDLDITQVNFGEEQVEDISNFLTTDYLPQATIDKYVNWKNHRERRRSDYIAKMKQYISTQETRDEIINKVPTDALNYDWDSFSLDELNEELEYFTSLVECIENDFTVNGKLDLESLKNSIYWWDYQSYTTWIIPNINTAIANYDKADDDKTDYNESWKTDWDLYGTTELNVMIQTYKNQVETTKEYAKSWDSLTTAEKSEFTGQQAYDVIHEAYVSAKTNLDSAQAKYDELVAIVDSYNTQLETIQTELTSIATDVSIKNSNFGFSDSELSIINDFYIDTDYSNENFLITSISSQEDKIDEELLLMNEALDELAKEAHPQYSFSCELDNLFNIPEFKNWHGDFEVGNFIRLGTTDTHQEKLRLVSISYNPMIHNNELNIEFSNMLTYNGKRSDLSSLFDSATTSSKNSISYGSSSSSSSDMDYQYLIRYILNSRQLSDRLESMNVGSLVTNEANIKAATIDYIKSNQIDAIIGNYITLNTDEIFAGYAKLDYIENNYLATDELNAKIATIDILNTTEFTSDSAFIKALQSINSTSITSTVDTQFVKDLIAGNLYSLASNTGLLTIGSDNEGKIVANGSTMQFTDEKNNVYLQIGTDSTGGHSLIVKDKNGETIIDGTGITENAIADELIVDSMVKKKDSTYTGISSDALNIDSVVTSINNGTTTIKSSLIYFDSENQTLNTKLSSIVSSMDDKLGDITETLDTEYYTKTETTNEVKTVLGSTNITTINGVAGSIVDTLNTVKDTADSHSQVIGTWNYAGETISSMIEQTTNSISLIVNGTDSSGQIQITPDAVTAIANSLVLSGKHIVLDGDTVIGAGFTLTASNIDVASLFSNNITVTNRLLLNGGYLTTSANRTSYNQAVSGLTIDKNGIGGWGNSNNYFNLSNKGILEATGANITGILTANAGSKFGGITVSNSGFDTDYFSLEENRMLFKKGFQLFFGDSDVSNITNYYGGISVSTSNLATLVFNSNNSAGVSDGFVWLDATMLQFFSDATQNNYGGSIVVKDLYVDNIYATNRESYVFPSTTVWHGEAIGAAYGGTGRSSLTSGYVLVGNGTGAVSLVNGTNTNTGNTFVKRDSSGNFSAGTITANLSGNATTATTATTANNLKYFTNTSNVDIGVDTVTSNGIGYIDEVYIFGSNVKDAALFRQVYSKNYATEIAQDYSTGQLATRSLNSGKWTDWRMQLDSLNYSNYALPLSGGTVTGNITAPTFIGNLSGNATTATTLATARTINGVSFDGSSDITVYDPYSTGAENRKGLTTEGWYRIAQCSHTQKTASTAILCLRKYHNNSQAESYYFLITMYHLNFKITKIAGSCTSNIAFPKLRIVQSSAASTYIYLEVYYAQSVQNVVYSMILHNTFEFENVNFTAGEIPDGYAAYEFENTSENMITDSIKTGTIFAEKGMTIPTAGSTWLTGMTSTRNITFTNNSGGNYHPMIRYVQNSGNIVNIGCQGNNFGFYSFKSGRTANAYDAAAYLDSSNNRFYVAGSIVGNTTLAIQSNDAAQNRITIGTGNSSDTSANELLIHRYVGSKKRTVRIFTYDTIYLGSRPSAIVHTTDNTIDGALGLDATGLYLNVSGTEGTTITLNESNRKTILHSSNYSDYALPLSGGTVTGTVVLSNTTDVSGIADNSPALIIGDRTGVHLELDGNEIQSKASSTTTNILHLNADGGKVSINNENSNYALTTPSFLCDTWVRTRGNTGWYNETYGGGWYMTDSTYIRNYADKRIFLTAALYLNSTNYYLSSEGSAYLNNIEVKSSTASTSKSTGALKVSGGVGIAGQMSADTVMIGDAVTLSFNAETESLDFIFS